MYVDNEKQIGGGDRLCGLDLFRILAAAFVFLFHSHMHDYYGAAEPPVRYGVSHLSGLTEPLH